MIGPKNINKLSKERADRGFNLRPPKNFSILSKPELDDNDSLGTGSDVGWKRLVSRVGNRSGVPLEHGRAVLEHHPAR